MRSLDHFPEVYLHRDPVDMRKSINGLSAIVLEEMKRPFRQGRLFVFVSRCGRRLKLIYWDRTGFALWYKRLEKERFRWPGDHGDEVIMSCPDPLEKLLSGFDVFQKPHLFLHYDRLEALDAENGFLREALRLARFAAGMGAP